MNRRIAVLQTAALPLGYCAIKKAGEGSRTLDLQLGKLSLYQLSYSRVFLKPSRALSISIGTAKITVFDWSELMSFML